MREPWDKVRHLDERSEEFIALHHYASELDDSIFEHEDQDEVVLCLNYDGPYSINNINRFLQKDNPNPAVHWDWWIYKIGDPVIFNEYNRFFHVIQQSERLDSSYRKNRYSYKI